MEHDTPITDAAEASISPEASNLKAYQVMHDTACGIERKLYLTRDTLAAINSSQVLEPALHDHIRNILEQTKP